MHTHASSNIYQSSVLTHKHTHTNGRRRKFENRHTFCVEFGRVDCRTQRSLCVMNIGAHYAELVFRTCELLCVCVYVF